MMKPVKIYQENDIRFITVDNEVFDWLLDEKQLILVKIAIKKNPDSREYFMENLKKHLITCFSEFVGRNINLKEICEAIETGWIDSVEKTDSCDEETWDKFLEYDLYDLKRICNEIG